MLGDDDIPGLTGKELVNEDRGVSLGTLKGKARGDRLKFEIPGGDTVTRRKDMVETKLETTGFEFE